jgi:hypothetical protein
MEEVMELVDNNYLLKDEQVEMLMKIEFHFLVVNFVVIT